LDDTTVKVWDFARCQEERSLVGHGWDGTTLAWNIFHEELFVSGYTEEEAMSTYLLENKDAMISSLWKINVAYIELTLLHVFHVVLRDSIVPNIY
jgi:hypothetical protein